MNCLFIAYAHFSLVFLSDLSAFHVENVNARGANVNLLFMVSGFHVALQSLLPRGSQNGPQMAHVQIFAPPGAVLYVV